MVVLKEDGPVGMPGPTGFEDVEGAELGAEGNVEDMGLSGREASPFGPDGSEISVGGGGGRGADEGGGGGGRELLLLPELLAAIGVAFISATAKGGAEVDAA